VGQVLLSGQGQPFGQGVEQLAELERAQYLLEVRADRVGDDRCRGLAGGGHHRTPSAPAVAASPTTRSRARPVAYSPGSRATGARAAAAVGGGGGGAAFSVARSGIEAIFDPDTTSTSKALPQAVLTASSP